MSEIYHTGVVGMRWGIKKTAQQNSRMIKSIPSNHTVNKIVSKLSESDKKLLGTTDNKKFTTLQDGKSLVKRIILKDGNKPISFFELHEFYDGRLNASVATINDNNYRGKGYAKKSVSSGLAWYNKNKDKLGYSTVDWFAKKENLGSKKLAETSGFKLNKNFENPEWNHYKYN